jgi:hypothetical protein
MSKRARTAKPIPEAEARWAALHAVVPSPHLQDFTWIVALRVTDGTRIDVFAHGWLNSELLLGDDGLVYELTSSLRYKVAAEPTWAVQRCLPNRSQWLERGGYMTYQLNVGTEDVVDDEWPAPVERYRPAVLAEGAADRPGDDDEHLAF